MTLLDHQRAAFEALGAWWNGDGAGILCMPTGSGKTRVATHFCCRLGLEQGRVLWLAHREELLAQAFASFSKDPAARPARLEKRRRDYHDANVIIASLDTLARDAERADLVRFRDAGGFGLVVLDECHHAPAPTWTGLLRFIDAAMAPRLLGLSATPTRTNELEVPALRRIFPAIIFEASAAELMRAEVLAQPVVHVCHAGRVEASRGEKERFLKFHNFPDMLLPSLDLQTSRNDLIASTYLEKREEFGPAIIFAPGTVSARAIHQKLLSASVRSELLLGTTPADARERIVEGMRSGSVDVIVNVGVLTEGTDVPRVRTVILGRPTRSEVLFRQMVGRAMRGPRVGGNKTCHLVSVIDDVTGLVGEALTDSLASNFDAREIAEILGIQSGGLVSRSRRAPPGEPPPPEGDVLVTLERLHVKVDGARLLGFYVARRQRSERRLPVFDSDYPAIQEWIANRSFRWPPAAKRLTRRLVQHFVAVANHRDADLAWEPLDRSPLYRAEAEYKQLASADHGESRGKVAPGLTPKPAARARPNHQQLAAPRAAPKVRPPTTPVPRAPATVLSPYCPGCGRHVPRESLSNHWAEDCELIRR